jgi:hypothetical protein
MATKKETMQDSRRGAADENFTIAIPRRDLIRLQVPYRAVESGERSG